MYGVCHIEQLSNDRWYIMWPDGTKAWNQSYKTLGWARRTLNLLQDR